MFETGTRLASEVVEDVELFFEDQRLTDSIWSNAYSFDTRIRRNIRLAEAPSYGQSIFQYSNDSNGAQDYRSLAQEVIQQTAAMQTVPSETLSEESTLASDPFCAPRNHFHY
jgi:chromosome partitioning protein